MDGLLELPVPDFWVLNFVIAYILYVNLYLTWKRAYSEAVLLLILMGVWKLSGNNFFLLALLKKEILI